MDAYFTGDGIEFRHYPFPPASVYRRGRIPYSQIRDFDPSAAPPEIRTVAGETLFISAEQKEELTQAATAAGLTIYRRVDVWDMLLEPFLDTEFSDEHEEQTLALLEKHGITRSETSSIRTSVAQKMLSYNSIAWEWCHLGLYDVLLAMKTPWDGLSLFGKRGTKRYQSFYWHAMELADRGLPAAR